MAAALALGLIGLFVSGAGVARADDLPAATTTKLTGWAGGMDEGVTYGWKFQVNSDVSATQLGIWDQGRDGLDFAHDIGLWDSSGQLLAVATVPAGTAGTLVQDFRYTPITPVTLSAGGSYVLGAFYSPILDDYDYLADGTFNKAALASSFTTQGAFFARNSSLAIPDVRSDGNEIFGPNLLFHPVPEPSTIVLLGMGVLGVLGWARRRSRKAV